MNSNCLPLYLVDYTCIGSTNDTSQRAMLSFFGIEGHYGIFMFLQGKMNEGLCVKQSSEEVISLCKMYFECITLRPKQIVDDVCSQA